MLNVSRRGSQTKKLLGPFGNNVNISNRSVDFHSLDLAKPREKTDAYIRADASWRKMLVVQPPVRDILIEDFMEDLSGPWKTQAQLTFEDGLRMGTLFDITADYVRSKFSSFGVQWCMFPPNMQTWEERLEERARGVSARTRAGQAVTPRMISEEIEILRNREVKNLVTLSLATFQECCPHPDDFKPAHEFDSLGHEKFNIEFGESTRGLRTLQWPDFL